MTTAATYGSRLTECQINKLRRHMAASVSEKILELYSRKAQDGGYAFTVERIGFLFGRSASAISEVAMNAGVRRIRRRRLTA